MKILCLSDLHLRIIGVSDAIFGELHPTLRSSQYPGEVKPQPCLAHAATVIRALAVTPE